MILQNIGYISTNTYKFMYLFIFFSNFFIYTCLYRDLTTAVISGSCTPESSTLRTTTLPWRCVRWPHGSQYRPWWRYQFSICGTNCSLPRPAKPSSLHAVWTNHTLCSAAFRSVWNDVKSCTLRLIESFTSIYNYIYCS